MDFTIIIPAYNEEKYLPATLESCFKTIRELSAKFAGEIVVVDNNSTDNTAKIAKSFGAKTVFEGRNCIAGARNRGAENASGRFLIFLDADTIASTELICEALNLLDSGKVCGGGCYVGFERSCSNKLAKVLASLWNKWIIRFFPVAAGSFVFCLRQGWKECGGFDESYYASEEVHFSLALRRWGKKHGMIFKIIPMEVCSSSRKFDSYSSRQIAAKILPLIFFPWMLKNKQACSIWYERK